MNGKNIQTVALEEIWQKNIDGFMPVLLEIYNPDLKWADGSTGQDNMYLRVINDSNAVKYRGKQYIPCAFTYTPPEKTGKSIGQAEISISAIDSRVMQMLRSVEVPCEVTVVAGFVKNESTYKFIPLDRLKATVGSASYDRTTARLSLTYKDVLTLNVPKDTVTKDMLPAVNQND